MQIVGITPSDRDGPRVHTVDIWFSERRRAWIVERLDADGHQVGLAYRCATEREAAACVEEWLRRHPETRLIAPLDMAAAEDIAAAENMAAAEKRVLSDVARCRDRAA